MNYLRSFAISEAGMNFERLRLDVASLNISHANVPLAPNAKPIRAIQVTLPAMRGGSFEEIIRDELKTPTLRGVTLREVAEIEPRLSYDPSHPDADDKGYVRFPAINMANEMVSLLTAVRGYEANIVAFNAAKVMAQKAMDIGGGR